LLESFLSLLGSFAHWCHQRQRPTERVRI
jgi:hypothetical protein